MDLENTVSVFLIPHSYSHQWGTSIAPVETDEIASLALAMARSKCHCAESLTKQNLNPLVYSYLSDCSGWSGCREGIV